MCKKILSAEKNNTGRQYEYDLAKAISLFFMIIIHSLEELSCFDTYSEIPTGFLLNTIEFNNGLSCATLFMFAMGLGVSYSSHNSPKELFQRGCRIFIAAYILNAARYGFYSIIICSTKNYWNINSILYCFLNIDILHFAGLSFMCIALFKKNNFSDSLVFAIAIVFQFVGNIFEKKIPISNNFCYLSGLFYYGYGSSFPFLQWFVYPAFGMLFGKFLKQVTDKKLFYRSLLILSAVLMLAFYLVADIIGRDIRNLFLLVDDLSYRQNFLSFLFSIINIIFEISLLYFILRIFNNKRFNHMYIYLSKNLNRLYIIQWMLFGTISFGMAITNCSKLDIYSSVLIGFFVFLISYLISKSIDQVISQKSKSISSSFKIHYRKSISAVHGL